ncbi:MAG: aminopeptidase P family protein [Bacteroidota bacterium]
MKKIFFLFCCSFLFADTVFSQEDLPTDYLSPAFHAGRRDSLRKLMPANSVMAVFAYPERVFSTDVNYTYHPNPDLYYFSGYTEPNALLLIFKEPRRYKDSIAYNEVLFVQKKDPRREQWTGRRLGVEGAKKLGFALVFNGEEFGKFPADFSGLSKIIFDVLPDSASTDTQPGDLSQMVSAFRTMIDLPADYDVAARQDLVDINKIDTGINTVQLMAYLKRSIASGKYKAAGLAKTYLEAKDSIAKRAVITTIENEKWNSSLYASVTNALRGIKTPEELELLRKAVEISAIGHAEVMKAIRPDMSEREIEGIHDYIQKRYGAEHWGYPPIVGAGNNGCVLHYEENTKTSIGPKTLLMDVGAEYHGYSADVTRTVPANGKFTPEQKIIYNLVYEAQEAAFKLCKEGSTFEEIETKVRESLSAGLLKLGLIKKAEDVGKYYPHGCSHHIGLDVHDKGSYDKLQKNMVITIEPGIYIPEGSDCDKKWWGIAVRIEDDLLIKEKDYELLSAYAPRKAEDVEKMVAEKSAFDDFKLPVLKSGKKGF